MLTGMNIVDNSPGLKSLEGLNHFGVCKVQRIRDCFGTDRDPELVKKLGVVEKGNLHSGEPVSKSIFALKDNNGCIEYPKLISESGLIHPGSGEVTQIPLQRRVMWHNVIQGFSSSTQQNPHLRALIQPYIGCCIDCVLFGGWGFKYTEGNDEPDIVCICPCHHCAESNGWVWGRYRQTNLITGELSEFKSIANNGTIGDFRGIPEIKGTLYENGNHSAKEHTNRDMIHRKIRKLWNFHTDHDPPKWKDFFEETPPWIHQIIIDLYGVKNSLDRFKETNLYLSDEEDKMLGERPQWREDVIHPLMDDSGEFSDSSISEFELSDDEDNDEANDEANDECKEEIERKEKISSAFSVLEGIMETDDQKLDQGKYLELCKLLKEIHQG